MYSQSKIENNIQGKKEHMTLRSSVKVKLKSDFTKLTKIQHVPYYRGVKLWDNLPETVQKEMDKSKFKTELT